MTAQIQTSRPEPDAYEAQGSMHKYGGWVIVIGGFFLASCLLAALVIGTFTASTAGNAVDDAMRSAASDDVSVAGTQRSTTVVMGLVNIGSGNTEQEQTSVTTTVQHKTADVGFDNPWMAILVITVITLIAVAAVLALFNATPEYPS